MGETVDDMTPLAKGGERDWVATAKVAAKVIGILASAIIAAIVSYRTAVGDFTVRAQVVKDKSEAGYQVTRPVLQDHDKRIAELEQLVHQLARQQHPPARIGSRPRAVSPPVVPAAPPPKALPRDLDQAQRQVYQGAPPAPVPPKDGGP